MHNNQMAIKDFTQAIEIDPKCSEAFYRRGISKLAARTFHDAIEDFRRSEDYEDKERNAGIPDGLGQSFHALKDYDQATGYYDTAISLDENNTEFLMHRAQCYFDQKFFKRAIADLERGLSISNNDP